MYCWQKCKLGQLSTGIFEQRESKALKSTCHIPTRLIKWKRHATLNVVEDKECLELSYTAGRNDDWENHFGKPAVFTEVDNVHIFCDPRVLLLSSYSAEMCTYVHQKTCIRMFTAAQFIIPQMGNPSKCLSVLEWISKLRCIHTMECYTAIRKKESQLYTTMWINLKNALLNRSQTQKKRYFMIPFQIQVTLFSDVRNQNPWREWGFWERLVMFCFLYWVLVTWVCAMCKTELSCIFLCTFVYMYYASMKSLKIGSRLSHWNLHTLLWYLTLMRCNF